MRLLSRRHVALVLASALALPGTGLAQEPPAAAPAGPAGAGSWEGWAKLTNDWPGQTCRYDGTAGTTSVRLELTAVEGQLRGSVAIDLPAEAGSGCPPLRKRYAIAQATQGAGTLSFTDAGGNEWALSLRERDALLQGLLAWHPGGQDEPLAEGFTSPNGQRPTTRLNGEVRLKRTVEAEAAGAATPVAEGKTGPPPHTSVGQHAGHLGLVLGANVVGLGLLYGVNKLGQGSSEAGVVTCSPRVCIVGPTINDPCFCEGNVVSGVSCGTVQPSGAPLLAPCDGKTVLCQATLSCNSGICEDRFGRCQY